MTAYGLSPERSGVYSAQPNVRALDGYATAARMVWLEPDLANVRDKQGLMDVVARSCGFPETFGRNWDALADSLQNLSWLPTPRGYVLYLRHATEAKQALGQDWPMLVEILRESAMYWKERRKAFIAFVEGDEELPAWR